MRRLLALATFLLLATAGCQKPRGEKEVRQLETVDVAPPADVELSVEEDVEGVRAIEDLAGVLPGGFPRDLPIFVPSSVVDTEQSEDGRVVVVLQSPAQQAKVEAFLDTRLPGAGWSSAGDHRYRNADGREVQIEIEPLGSVTRLRITYR